MRDVLVWIEGTGLGHVMRESGPWTYAAVNTSHILGVAALFGSILVLDLRLLGVSRRLPLAALASTIPPIAIVGFVIAVATGSAMLATKATAYAGNPFLLIKFPAIALGLINVAVLNLTPAWRAGAIPQPSRGGQRQGPGGGGEPGAGGGGAANPRAVAR